VAEVSRYIPSLLYALKPLLNIDALTHPVGEYRFKAIEVYLLML